jgi:hypothetical protein
MDMNQNDVVSIYFQHQAVFAASQAPEAGDAEQAALINSWTHIELMDGSTREVGWLKNLVFLERVTIAFLDDEGDFDASAAKANHELYKPASLGLATP